MLFPTVEFGIFFFIVFAVGWLLKDRSNLRKLFLTIASYFFYGFWNKWFTLLLLTCSVGNYFFGRAIGNTDDDRKRRMLVGFAIAWNLVILGFFKYFGFFMTSMHGMIGFLGLEAHMPLLEIILPVGISFFTFQAMSYVIDVYRKEIPATNNILDILLYISFFPQLVAGPIVRAKVFLPQLLKKPDLSQTATARALLLIMTGLFKKVIIANYIATELVDPVFENPLAFSGLEAFLAVYGYAIQIYCDFSAYSEIAIGVAALLGFSFPDNFNDPYRAQSLREFWRRWHISLSTWLRDYLYISLGGNRMGKFRTYLNLAITMLLGGLWHGASWNFVFWGALHGVGLGVERYFIERFGPLKKNIYIQILSVIFIFNFVCLGWVFFRANNFTLAMEYLRALGNTSTPSTLLTPFVILLLVIGIGMHFLPKEPGTRMRVQFSRLPTVAQGAILGLLLLMLSAFGPEGVAPFIYFQF